MKTSEVIFISKRILYCLNILLLIVAFAQLNAANFQNLETEITQPDGTILNLFSSGDEYFNYLHDANNYTIIQNIENGYYYYAQQSENGKIYPSSYIAGKADPEEVNLVKNIRISGKEYKERVAAFNKHQRKDIKASSREVLNNIAIYIRFSDQTEFADPREVFDQRFNDFTPGEESVRNYFNEVSYEQLTMVTYHYPECDFNVSLSYQDSHPRNYYVPYSVDNPDGYTNSDEETYREQTLLVNAINAISDQIPADLNIDYNQDGYVDNVCFIIRGPHTAWSNLLWAHRWSLFLEEVYINSALVHAYTLQPENQNTVRTLCHELFHTLGAPDLYHYEFDGIAPAGPWDIMESGYCHMGAYMKTAYGHWIENVPEITSSGLYTINPITSAENNCYVIYATNAYDQFYVIEYRKKDPATFERNIPDSGLLVYRIFPDAGWGNAEGPPDQVYIYRPGGTLTADGSCAQAHFSAQSGRTAINNYTDPRPFLVNNSYGGLNIYNISEAGDQISFYVDMNPNNTPPVCEITSPQEGSIILDSENITLTVAAEDYTGDIISMTFFLDNSEIAELFTEPYEYNWNPATVTPGQHKIKVIAESSSGLSSTDEIVIRTIAATESSWLYWYTDEPVYSSFGRGAIHIKTAMDVDLGESEFIVDAVSLNLEADPYGFPETPGLVDCKIYRFDEDLISDEVLLDLGSFVSDMNGRHIENVSMNIPISGHVALVMDIYEYQRIMFDINGINGHSWLTETDRPWVDAISRGMVGAADIALKVHPEMNDTGDDTTTPIAASLQGNYPNPFSLSSERNVATSIKFTVNTPSKVEINVFNLKGQKVKTLINDNFEKGVHEVSWNGKDATEKALSSGIYLYQMRVNQQTIYTKKCLLLK